MEWDYRKSIVIECAYDPMWETYYEQNNQRVGRIGGWVYQRLRHDKQTGNHISVVNNIINSINENVSISKSNL